MSSKLKSVTNVNWAMAGSVVAGIALFGGLVYAIRRLPSNAVTQPVKDLTNAVAI